MTMMSRGNSTIVLLSNDIQTLRSMIS